MWQLLLPLRNEMTAKLNQIGVKNNRFHKAVGRRQINKATVKSRTIRSSVVWQSNDEVEPWCVCFPRDANGECCRKNMLIFFSPALILMSPNPPLCFGIVVLTCDEDLNLLFKLFFPFKAKDFYLLPFSFFFLAGKCSALTGVKMFYTG